MFYQVLCFTRYLLAAAHGLYGQNEFGNARVYNTFCQCDPSNLMAPGMDCGVNGGWNSLDIRYFVKPFVWLDGIDKARKYGAERQERILSVQTGELSPSVVPMDGHQVIWCLLHFAWCTLHAACCTLRVS